MSRKIYILVDPRDWKPEAEEFRRKDLELEGFIHAAFREQLGRVFSKYYAAISGVLVLEVDPDLLGRAELKIEGRPGGDLYPHVYGAIPAAAIVSVLPWEKFSGA
jgi:uncharacterized protein (DUF952 family)